MPLNPNIITNIGNSQRARQAGQRQERSLNLQERSYNDAAPMRQAQQQMSQEQLAAQRYNNLNARDKRRFQSSIEGMATIDSIARQYQDPQEKQEAVTGYLNNRLTALQRRQAAGETVDANETLEALGMLNKPGGFDTLLKQSTAAVEAGRALGYLEAPRAAGQPGGATGYIVERIMNDNPGMSYTDAFTLAKTASQGIVVQDGQAQPMPGFAQSRGAIKYGETAGGEQAKQQYAGGIAFESAQGKQDAQSLQKLPKDLSIANITIKQIDNILAMPGLAAGTGLSSVLPTVPGTDRADFEAAREQIQGAAFLQARDMLKGGGAISDGESSKAEAAQARMKVTQSEEVFRKSMREFQEAVRDGAAKIRAEKEAIEHRRGNGGNGGQSSPQFSPVRLSDEQGYEAPLPPGGAQDGSGGTRNPAEMSDDELLRALGQ